MRVDVNVKPIPQYIKDRIYKADKKSISFGTNTNRFYCYFTKMENKLVKVTVAVRRKEKKWACKQVAIHAVNATHCITKDMEYFWMGGYVVGWFSEGFSRVEKNYEDGLWYKVEDKYFDPYAIAVNIEYILKFDKYKYSAIDKYRYYDYFKYLKLYEQYPIAEMLVKLDLSNLATSKTILKELSKNKQFRKWIYANRLELKQGWFDKATIIKAFRNNQSLRYTQQIVNTEKAYSRNCSKFVKEFIGKENKNKFIEYISKQKTHYSSYADYLTACNYLNIDMNLDKNRYPHNFKYWHDMRIDQYRTKLAEENKKKQQEFNNKFKKVADKYVSLERLLIKDDYICLIAKSPQQLRYEGQELNHCVGSMNYDQKFAREETLIFFIRNRLTPNTPLVTLEYSLKTHKVLQCYGYEDSKPEEQILQFVNKVWLPYANRKIRKIA